MLFVMYQGLEEIRNMVLNEDMPYPYDFSMTNSIKKFFKNENFQSGIDAAVYKFIIYSDVTI